VVRDRRELGFHEVGQRHVLEEEIEELLAREAEAECVLAFAVVGGAAPLAAAARGALDLVAGDVLLVSRQDHLAPAAGAVLEDRFVQVARWDRDARVAVGFGDLAAGDRARHRLADLRAVALEEALRVDRALVARVLASVDDVRHTTARLAKHPIAALLNGSCLTLRAVAVRMTDCCSRPGHDDLRTRRYHSTSRRTCFGVYPFATMRSTKFWCFFCSSAEALALNEITGSRSSVVENIFFSITVRSFS
jgi:hypothetical protein